MKRLIFFSVFLFYFSSAYAQMIAQAVSINNVPAFKLVKFGNYVYLWNGGGVYSMKSDLSSNWKKLVEVSGEGDLTITPRGYIVTSGRNGTFLSTDSGKTWQANYYFLPFALQALPDNSVLVGVNSHSYPGVLYRLRLDRGTNINDMALWEVLKDSSMFGSNNVPRFLYRLQDGRIITQIFGAGSMLKQGIWYSDDNGQTWTRSNYYFFHLIESATDDGQGNVMVADDYGHIYLSEDTAKTWRKITRSEIGDIRDSIGYVRYVYYSPSMETWFICGRDRLFYSIIDVYHWSITGVEAVLHPSAVVEIGSNKVLVADSCNWLVMRDITGVSGKENIQVLLSQNYPNPFNSSTTIKYSIPKKSFVKIKVFDILGGEIATLVDEEKTAGNYEVKFDASNLPSGIYFYRFETPQFQSIKKMIYLK